MSTAAQPNATTAGTAVAKKTRATSITKAAYDTLYQSFTAKNWLLNNRLPRGEYSFNLNKIVEKYGLKRSQVTLQLLNYKHTQYGFSQVKLMFNPEQISRKMQLSGNVVGGVCCRHAIEADATVLVQYGLQHFFQYS